MYKRQGKNVVTANKDLMAVHGGELLDIASHNGCLLYTSKSRPNKAHPLFKGFVEAALEHQGK